MGHRAVVDLHPATTGLVGPLRSSALAIIEPSRRSPALSSRPSYLQRIENVVGKNQSSSWGELSPKLGGHTDDWLPSFRWRSSLPDSKSPRLPQQDQTR